MTCPTSIFFNMKNDNYVYLIVNIDVIHFSHSEVVYERPRCSGVELISNPNLRHKKWIHLSWGFFFLNNLPMRSQDNSNIPVAPAVLGACNSLLYVSQNLAQRSKIEL